MKSYKDAQRVDWENRSSCTFLMYLSKMGEAYLEEALISLVTDRLGKDAVHIEAN